MKTKLTKEQELASTNLDESIAVIAGAGTGKTRVLTQRCKNIAGNNPENLNSLLAITFTEKAATELKARLYNALPNSVKQNINNAWIGTFHSFYARLLNHFNYGGKNVISESKNTLLIKQIAENAIANELEKDNEDVFMLLDDLGLHSTTRLIENLLDFRWHVTASHLRCVEYHTSEVCNGLETSMNSATMAIFTRAKEMLENTLLNNGETDFQQLEIDALNLLNNSNIKKQCQKMFKHILVDECQDTNDIQIEIIKNLFCSNNKLFVVGDPKQSIYRFRGANPKGFMALINLIEDNKGQLINLNTNFRSASNIIDFVNKTANKLEIDKNYLNLAPSKNESIPGIKKILIKNDVGTSESIRTSEAEGIAKVVSNAITNGTNPNEIAILFRALGSVNIYQKTLKKHGIPVKIIGSKIFLNQPEVMDIISFLKWCKYNDQISEIAILRSPLIGISDEDLLLKKYFKNEMYLELKKLKKISKNIMPIDLIEKLLQTTGYKRMLAEIDPTGSRLGNIEHLMEIARELPFPQTLKDFLDVVDELGDRNVRFGDAPASFSTKAVSLMSVHAAKGLEWDLVILPDLIHKPKNKPLKYIFSLEKGLGFSPEIDGKRSKTEAYNEIRNYEDDEELMEEKRLIYVALTRAKKGIFIPNVLREKQSGTWEKLIDPLLRDLCEANTKHSSKVKIEINVPSNHFKQINFDPSILTVSQIESYDKSPKDFLMKYIKGVEDKQKPKANKSQIPAHIKGEIIHSYIYKLCHGMSNLESIKTAALEKGLELSPILKKEAQSIKANIDKRFPINDLSKGYHELPFLWQFGGSTISGTIDWLRPVDISCHPEAKLKDLDFKKQDSSAPPQNDNFYEIIDFKTDSTLTNSKNYELQLNIYALAAESSGIKIAGTKLFFVTQDKIVENQFDEKQRKQTKEKLSKIIKAIANHKFE